ncbi:hypothetical protein BaRGS_00004729 [Batillaria attramentaria]|uniref:Uncharacterized protein n=1 Tax=Batillaria attramentaria TaxID=370345 RepID=A0ABD0LYE9_9CAEN
MELKPVKTVATQSVTDSDAEIIAGRLSTHTTFLSPQISRSRTVSVVKMLTELLDRQQGSFPSQTDRSNTLPVPECQLFQKGYEFSFGRFTCSNILACVHTAEHAELLHGEGSKVQAPYQIG